MYFYLKQQRPHCKRFVSTGKMENCTENKTRQMIAASILSKSDICPSDYDSDATLVYSCDDDAVSPLVESCKKRSFEDLEVSKTNLPISGIRIISLIRPLLVFHFLFTAIGG